MTNNIIFNTEAREGLRRGVDALANAVKVTLGPKGRNVLIEKQFGPPHITKDGVSIAKEIELNDPMENVGAQLIKEVALKTVDNAGDGTSTATVLTQALINAGLKNVTAGANPMDLKRGIDKAVKLVINHIKAQSKSIGNSKEKIQQVASISANNDSEVGEIIADAMSKVQQEGIITIEEAKGLNTIVEVVEGMQFDRGYLSPYFVTDNDKMETVYENPYILICDRKISTMKDLLPILEQVAQIRKPLLIIADDVDGEALTTLVMNRLRGTIQVTAVKSPSFGNNRKDIINDIAILTGGVIISEETNTTFHNVNLHALGKCEKVTIGKDYTTIISGAGEKAMIANRVNQIKAQIEKTTSDYDREKLQERLAKLAGGVAVIYVGAASEVEMKEKKDRFDDALHATRAALEEGIIPGGGVAYIRAISSLDGAVGENEDETTGIQIVRRSLEEPLRQIVANAGMEGSVVVNKVKELQGDYGFNARTEVYEDLHLAGVIDPTKVARVALENAASIAAMILTTECVLLLNRKQNEIQSNL